MDSIPFSDPVKPGSLEPNDDLSLKTAQEQFAQIKKDLQEQLGPELQKISGDYFRRKAVEFVANREAIRKTMREQRKRRGIKVSKSVLP